MISRIVRRATLLRITWSSKSSSFPSTCCRVRFAPVSHLFQILSCPWLRLLLPGTPAISLSVSCDRLLLVQVGRPGGRARRGPARFPASCRHCSASSVAPSTYQGRLFSNPPFTCPSFQIKRNCSTQQHCLNQKRLATRAPAARSFLACCPRPPRQQPRRLLPSARPALCAPHFSTCNSHFNHTYMCAVCAFESMFGARVPLRRDARMQL